MPDTGYTKERDAPHQAAVREFIEWMNKTGVYLAKDIQNKGLHKWAPDVAIYRKNAGQPFSLADVKTQSEGYNNISVASEEHDYQLSKTSDKYGMLIVFKWHGFWLGADMEWLAEHQIGGDREPTGNGSKTRFRLFGPLKEAPLVSELLGPHGHAMTNVVKLAPASDRFEEFWQAYPCRKGKLKATEKWKAITTTGLKTKNYDKDSDTYVPIEIPRTDPQDIIDGAKRYYEANRLQGTGQYGFKDGGRYLKHADTWLNQAGWLDE